MSERPKFTPEESEEIGKVSVDIANIGEDAIDATASLRIKLQLANVMFLEENLNNPVALEIAREMNHEIDVMDEVVRRARVIMQMEGTDSLSILKNLNFKASFGKMGDIKENNV